MFAYARAEIDFWPGWITEETFKKELAKDSDSHNALNEHTAYREAAMELAKKIWLGGRHSRRTIYCRLANGRCWRRSPLHDRMEAGQQWRYVRRVSIPVTVVRKKRLWKMGERMITPLSNQKADAIGFGLDIFQAQSIAVLSVCASRASIAHVRSDPR
jgi:hypothetical protein